MCGRARVVAGGSEQAAARDCCVEPEADGWGKFGDCCAESQTMTGGQTEEIPEQPEPQVRELYLREELSVVV